MKNPKEVLVVEDDPEINQLVGAYVQHAGYRYRQALDGQTGLRCAREHRPSLIILDIMLPDLDGFEVCDRLRKDDDTRHIPVLMLTALDREEHRQRGRKCGAAAYMTKPFDPDDLLRAVHRHIGSNGDKPAP